MGKRPPGVDRETWLRERAAVWRRRNRILNVLMAVAMALFSVTLGQAATVIPS